MINQKSLRDPLFKGCTRPAMMFGVPLTPLVIVTIIVLLISLYTTFLAAALLVPIVLAMKQVTKTDDQQFRLLGLKFQFRVMNFNHNKKFWKASAYSPIAFGNSVRKAK